MFFLIWYLKNEVHTIVFTYFNRFLSELFLITSKLLKWRFLSVHLNKNVENFNLKILQQVPKMTGKNRSVDWWKYG